MSNISMDPEVVLGCLKYRDLRYLLNDNAGNYASEELIHPNYICGVFDAFNEVSDYWVDLVNQIRNFVQDFDSIPEPNFETNISELDFLNKNASVTTQGGKLNVRAEASVTASVLGQLSNGAVLSIIDDEPVDGFYKVEYLDEKGAVHRGYVSEDYVTKNVDKVKTTASVSTTPSTETVEEETPIVSDTPSEQGEKEQPQPIVHDTPLEQGEKEQPQPIVHDTPLEQGEKEQPQPIVHDTPLEQGEKEQPQPIVHDTPLEQGEKEQPQPIVHDTPLEQGEKEQPQPIVHDTPLEQTETSNSMGERYVSTEKSNLNFREAPGTDSKIIGSLSKDSKVTIVGQEDENGWVKVNSGGKEGYVKSSYLSDTSSAEFKSMEPTTKYVNTKNANGHLNIRTAPSTTTGKVMDMFDNNAEVEVIGKIGNWYKVSYNGKDAYVNAKYIKDTK